MGTPEPTSTPSVGMQIRMRRQALGWTQQELATRLSVTEQAVRHWENDRSHPTGKKKAPLEAALGARINWTESPDFESPLQVRLLPEDWELLSVLVKLPAPVKAVLQRMALMHLEAVQSAMRP